MTRAVVLILSAALTLLAACRQTDLGEGGSKVSGSGGGAGAKSAANELVTCDTAIATIALAESPNGYTVLSSYQLPPLPLPSSLSDLKHRSENSPARGQTLTVLQWQYRDIAQKTGEV